MAKQVKFDISIIGVEAYAAALKDPKLLAGPLVQLYDDAGKIGQRAAVLAVDGGTGKAAQSMNFRIYPERMKIQTAMSIKSRATSRSIEFGRKPGTRPPIAQIIRWKNAVGHPESAFAIAQGIKRRGTKGRFYMKAARDNVNTALPRLIAEMTRRVEQRWGRNVS